MKSRGTSLVSVCFEIKTAHDGRLTRARLALKTITSELPPSGSLVPKACAKLTPQLLQQLSDVCCAPQFSCTCVLIDFQTSTSPEALIETLSILSILVTEFPSFIANLDLEPPPLAVISPLLSHPRPAVRKRATQTLAQFAPLASGELFEALLTSEIRSNLSVTVSIEKQRTAVSLIAAIARVTPQRIAPALSEIVPGVLKLISNDDDELRDGSLQVRVLPAAFLNQSI